MRAPPPWSHLALTNSQRSYLQIPSPWRLRLQHMNFQEHNSIYFVVQLLSRVWLFVTPWTAACQASLSFTISWSLLKLMSIESVMPSNHLFFCCLFSFYLQFFPASVSFPMSQLFTSGDQNVGTSPSASVLPMNTQSWFPLGHDLPW